ncbi:glycoside hydrolase family 32 protein [Halobacillus halophilus]|nr:glycoside hydrolase family 32 protein [Halobacillus halophilus]
MNLHQPIYHFSPKKNWMNDPNGPIYYKGEYHLFYQHNPNGDQWGSIHWGHAKSRDLVYWEHLPLALYPSIEHGEEHCFSGCTVVEGETARIFYTSIGPNKHPFDGADQWMAVSQDGMKTWRKDESNPILTADIHGETKILEWRDPFVWQEDHLWYMVIGGKHEGHGCAALYSSENLYDWRFVSIFASGKEEIWECPNVFKLNAKRVLLYSPSGPVQYRIGEVQDGRFKGEFQGTLDFSGWEGFYAPNSLEDENGDRIIIGWLTENARGDLSLPGMWAGVQSIPRKISIQSDALYIEPIPALKSLRYNASSFQMESLPNNPVRAEGKGRALEIDAVFSLADPSSSFQISVLESLEREEQTKIVYDDGILILDRTMSSVSEEVHKWKISGTMAFPEDGQIHLRVFVDHSTIEVFGNGNTCISSRVYPLKKDSIHVSVQSRRGEVCLRDMNVWNMKSIWD